MSDDELAEPERRALDAWTALTPPAGFADRVVAARAPASRRRWPFIAAAAVVAAAAALVAVIATPGSHAASGTLAAAERTTAQLGERATVVAEPTATLGWRVDAAGAADIEQSTGDVFYRVEPGGPFVVHTPAGDVRVTGTCFRIEVEPMTKAKQLILSGTAGAAIATAVVITVYEGRVIADSHGARTELAAGTRATMSPDGKTVVMPGLPAIASITGADDATASRDELAVRAASLRGEVGKLRARVAELEHKGGSGGDRDRNETEEGRLWYDPSSEKLKEWAASCHVRSDEPGFDRGFQPLKSADGNSRGLEPGELSGYNAAMTEVFGPYKALVRAMYLEATGDTAGADTLSIDSMRAELEEKSAPGEHAAILQKIANERAGLATPPTDLSHVSPLERVFRAYIQLGDQTEAALAKRLGPQRAKDIRGEGWGSRSNWSGCPN